MVVNRVYEHILLFMPPCVALCASHIDNPERLSLLKCSIDSMLNQVTRVPIWISISTPWESLDLSYQNIPDFHLFFHSQKKMSQFEHFWFLVQQMESGVDGRIAPLNLGETFFMFFDDDDFSHPERTRFYLSANDQGQNSLLATDGILMMYEPANTTHHSLETCHGEPSTNGHEYFMYCVRGSMFRQFCEILIQFGLISNPICDVLLASVLFSTKFLSRSCRPVEWIYAYSIRDEAKKNRAREMNEYMKLIQVPGLLDRLEKEFDVKWYQGLRGYISIYGNEEFISSTPFPATETKKNNKVGGKEGFSIFSNFYGKLKRYREKEPYFFYLVCGILLIILYFLVRWILGKVSTMKIEIPKIEIPKIEMELPKMELPELPKMELPKIDPIVESIANTTAPQDLGKSLTSSFSHLWSDSK